MLTRHFRLGIFIGVLLIVGLACASTTGTDVPFVSKELTRPANAPASEDQTQPETNQHKSYLPNIRSERDGDSDISSIAGEPHIEITVSQETVKVGDMFLINCRVIDIGLPNFYLAVNDGSGEEGVSIAKLTTSGEVHPLDGESQLVELVSAGITNSGEAVFTLRAIQPGVITVTIMVTGEIHYAEGATMTGGGSDSVQIIISE